MTAIQHLKSLALDHIRTKSPDLPYPDSFVHKYDDKKPGHLVRCMKDYLKFVCPDAMVDSISNTGRMVDGRTEVTNVMGQRGMIGSVGYIKGTGTRGISDTKIAWTNLHGRHINWSAEIKIGRDIQSQAQKEYEAKVKRSGGHYSLVRTFEDFVAQFNQLNNLPLTQTKLF